MNLGSGRKADSSQGQTKSPVWCDTTLSMGGETWWAPGPRCSHRLPGWAAGTAPAPAGSSTHSDKAAVGSIAFLRRAEGEAFWGRREWTATFKLESQKSKGDCYWAPAGVKAQVGAAELTRAVNTLTSSPPTRQVLARTSHGLIPPEAGQRSRAGAVCETQPSRA